MSRPRSVPAILRRALDARGGTCYGHCRRAVRERTVPSRLPGVWRVRSCPGGAVSVSYYAEWSRTDPRPAVARVLRAWSAPRTIVARRDLRGATRHGPELDPGAARYLAQHRPLRPIRVVYWRRYPERGRDGAERRLYACFRRAHSGPVFFVAPTAGGPPRCPRCDHRLPA